MIFCPIFTQKNIPMHTATNINNTQSKINYDPIYDDEDEHTGYYYNSCDESDSEDDDTSYQNYKATFAYFFDCDKMLPFARAHGENDFNKYGSNFAVQRKHTYDFKKDDLSLPEIQIDQYKWNFIEDAKIQEKIAVVSERSGSVEKKGWKSVPEVPFKFIDGFPLLHSHHSQAKKLRAKIVISKHKMKKISAQFLYKIETPKFRTSYRAKPICLKRKRFDYEHHAVAPKKCRFDFTVQTRLCRYLKNCSKAECTYAHSLDEWEPIRCRGGDNCTSVECTYMHPKETKMDCFNKMFPNHIQKSDAVPVQKRLVCTQICKFANPFKNEMACSKMNRGCKFAHTIDEWNPIICKFGEKCRSQSTCKFYHNSETKEKYYQRITGEVVAQSCITLVPAIASEDISEPLVKELETELKLPAETSSEINVIQETIKDEVVCPVDDRLILNNSDDCSEKIEEVFSNETEQHIEEPEGNSYTDDDREIILAGNVKYIEEPKGNSDTDDDGEIILTGNFKNIGKITPKIIVENSESDDDSGEEIILVENFKYLKCDASNDLAPNRNVDYYMTDIAHIMGTRSACIVSSLQSPYGMPYHVNMDDVYKKLETLVV